MTAYEIATNAIALFALLSVAFFFVASGIAILRIK